MGKRIWNIAGTVLVVLVVLLAVALVGVRLVGLEPYVILSGSMEPVYPVGSLVYVQRVDADRIAVGDPIAFVMNEDLVVAIHRVIGVDAAAQQFETKGDANDAPDAAPVHFNNLIGKPVLCIPKLGYVSDYLTNPPGMYIGGAAALVLLLLMFVPDWIRKLDEKDSGKKPVKAQKGQPDLNPPAAKQRSAAEQAGKPRHSPATPAQQGGKPQQRVYRDATPAQQGSKSQQRVRRDATAAQQGSKSQQRARRDAAPAQRPGTSRQPDAHSAEARRLATERAMAEAERALSEADSEKVR